MISVFPVVTSLAVITLSIKLLYSYPVKNTPCIVYLFTFASWILSFGIIAILPYDIYLTLAHSDTYSLEVVWKGVYWSVFVLCWLVLPLMQYHLQAGDFSFFRRCCSALLMHAWFIALMAVAGALFVLYLVLARRMDKEQIYVYLIVLSNTYGLFLVMTLLGYGLVEVPRAYWRQGNLKGYRKYYQYQAYVINKQKINAELKLIELAKMILAADKAVSIHKKQYRLIRVLKEKLPKNLVADVIASGEYEERQLLEEMKTVKKSRLVKIHRRLKLVLTEHQRCIARWSLHCSRAFRQDDIVHNTGNGRMLIQSSLWRLPTGCCARFRGFVEWFWYTQIRALVYRFLALAFACLSCIIVLGEGTLYMNTPVSVFTKLFDSPHGDIQTQLLVCVPLLYIVFCTYYALFSLRLSGFYGIYSNNQTDPSNLLWCAQFLCQLIAPLCYNFLKLIKVDNTEFSKVMKVIDSVPVLGNDFIKYFPLTLVVFSGLNLLQVYTRLLSLLGLDRFRFSESYEDDRVEEGKERLRMERIARETKASPNQQELLGETVVEQTP